MKKEILSAIGIIAGILFGTTLSLSAQEKLSLKQCREMALKYNKDTLVSFTPDDSNTAVDVPQL